MPKLYRICLKKATFLGLIFILFSAHGALAKIPDDPSYSDQKEMWEQINAPRAWDYATGSHKVTVAVIDTGADIWHDDLKNNIWANTKEIPDNGIDDDHNGYVDDVHGWNFVEDNNDPRNSVFDDDGIPEAVRHGTVIAGLIGASGDNELDGTGLSWNVKVMPLRAISNDGSGTYRNVAAAVNYAANNGADVISISFIGTEPDAYLRQSLFDAYQKGVVIVSAVGNAFSKDERDLDATAKYPACFDNGDKENWLIGVSAVDDKNELSYFANFGNCVDIVAPGQNLWSTERYAPEYGYTEEFGGHWNGTSFSAPLVAGTAALIKSLHPEWGAKQIVSLILSNAAPIDSFNPGFERKLGVGLLDAGKAVSAAAAIPVSAQPMKNFYFFRGNEFYRYSTDDETAAFLTNVREAEIVDFDAGSFNLDGRTQAAILIRRGKFYYVRLIDADGSLIKEFPVEQKRGRVIYGVRILHNGNDAAVLVADSGKKDTGVTEYSLDGAKGKNLVLGGLFNKWSTAQNSAQAVFASATQNRINLLNLKWDSGARKTFVINNAGGIYDLAFGKVWAGGGEQAAVLFNRANQNRLTVVDFNGAGSLDLPGNVGKSIGRIALGGLDDSTLSYIMPYNKAGGIFNIENGKGDFVGQIKLPVF